MAAPRLEPHLVMADQSGNIYDDPQLLMVCRRGAQWGLPRPDELMPLPEESELFLLPGRRAVGLNPESGETEVLDQLAVAAFAAPAHTLSAPAAPLRLRRGGLRARPLLRLRPQGGPRPAPAVPAHPARPY